MAKNRREMAVGMSALLLTNLRRAGHSLVVERVCGPSGTPVGSSRKAEFDVLNQLFARFLPLGKLYFQRRKISDLVSRATGDSRSVRDFIGLGLLILVDSTPVFV